MSEKGYSTGPWVSDKYGLCIKDSAGEIVCHVRSGDNIEADARLITVAPDMLAELHRAEAFISGFEDDELQEGIAELLSGIRRVLAKATGAARS